MKRWLLLLCVVCLLVASYKISYKIGYNTGSKRHTNVLVEVYDADNQELAFAEVLEDGKIFRTSSFPHPLKVSGISLTIVRDIDNAIKEAREIRERAGWTRAPYTGDGK